MVKDYVDNSRREFKSHSGPIKKLLWGKGDSFLASVSDNNSIQIWNVQSRSEQKEILTNEPICDIAWLPDDNLLVSFADKARIYFVKGFSRNITSFPIENLDIINDICRLPNGNLVENPPNSSLDFRDSETKEKIKDIIINNGSLHSLHTIQKNPLLFGRSQDGTMILWRTDTWAKQTILNKASKHKSIQPFAFHPKWPIFATTADEDHIIKIWKVNY